MDASGIVLGISIAAILVAVAGFFIYRQSLTLKTLRTDTTLAPEQRKFLTNQCWRRLAGAVALILLAGMMIGALFLNYDPQQTADGMLVDRQKAREAVHGLFYYFVTMILLVLVTLALAIIDFWATARHGLQQQRQLVQEHQQLLEAELLARKHRQDNS
jgi:hypothetical protein